MFLFTFTYMTFELNRLWISTLVQATSCEVDRAHWVAAAITRFCNVVSSATWATFLAFRTNIAAALATALARFIRMSWNTFINVLHWNTAQLCTYDWKDQGRHYDLNVFSSSFWLISCLYWLTSVQRHIVPVQKVSPSLEQDSDDDIYGVNNKLQYL